MPVNGIFDVFDMLSIYIIYKLIVSNNTLDDYAEINNFQPELSSGGDKYFHLRNYSEYSEYTSGFFLSLMIFIKS